MKSAKAWVEFAEKVAALGSPQDHPVSFFDLEVIGDFELGTDQFRAAVNFITAALLSSTPMALLERKKTILGAWEFLDSKGSLSTGLRSTLIRYEFEDGFRYWHGESNFSAYIAPSSVPTAGSSYSSAPSRSGNEGLFLPGATRPDGGFGVLLCSSDAKSVRELNVKRGSGELSIDGNTFKRGGVRPW